MTRDNTDYFLLKRLIRIVPVYWVGTMAMVAIILFFPHLFRSAQFDTTHFIYSMLFIAHHSEAAGFSPILKLGWTLNYEMFFYVLFALSMRINHRWRCEIAALLLFSCVFFMPAHHETSPLAFYSKPILLHFILGMAIAKLWDVEKIKNLRIADHWQAVTLVFSFAVFLAATIIVDTPVTINIASLLRVLGYGLPSVLLLMVCLQCESFFAKKKHLRSISLSLGDWSYSMYIFNIYIVAALGRLLHMSLPFAFFAPLAYGLVIAVSALAFVLIERPSRQYLRRILVRADD